MGQYHIVANLDKKEFLDPTAFGSGLKLLEFGCDGTSVMTGLTLLLAASNGYGGGDFPVRDDRWSDLPGRWAGDRVVIAGDYDDDPNSPAQGVYSLCRSQEGKRTGLRELTTRLTGDLEWEDISWDVIGALMEDSYLADHIENMIARKVNWDKSAKAMWEYLRPGKPFPIEKEK